MRENQDAESLLPRRNVGTTHTQCARAYDWARARCSPRGRSCTPSQTTTPNPHPTPRVTGSEPRPLPVSRRARPRSACSEPRTQLRSVRGRARRRATEGSGRLRDRGSGECARNDDQAPDKTAAKRDENTEQTDPRRSHSQNGGRTIDLRRGIRISSSASSGRLRSSGASRALPLGSPKQRALLGLLLVHANEPDPARATHRGALGRCCPEDGQRGPERLSLEAAATPRRRNRRPAPAHAGSGLRAACPARGARRHIASRLCWSRVGGSSRAVRRNALR